MQEDLKYRDITSPSSPGGESFYSDLLELAKYIVNEMEEIRQMIYSLKQEQSKAQKESTGAGTRNADAFKGTMNQINVEQEFFTSDEVMKLLRISKRTLQNYRDAKKIPFGKYNGRILYPKGKIIESFKLNEEG